MEAVSGFRQLFERELPHVYNTLRRLGVRWVDLPGATQEVFATAAAILDDHDPEQPARPWLFGITYRIGMRYIQKAPADDGDRWGSVEVEVERPDTRDVVRAALEQVAPPRRAVLMLSYLEGLSVPEIASTLQLPVDVVYPRLHRGRQEFLEAAKRLGWRAS